MSYILTWKDKALKTFGTFKNKQEAETTRSIATMQMELAEHTDEQLKRYFKIKKI